MHVETVGAGPDCILIHGWAMHAGVFAPLTQGAKPDCITGAQLAGGQKLLAAL